MSRLHCCEWEPPVVQPERFAQWSRDVQILFKYFPDYVAGGRRQRLKVLRLADLVIGKPLSEMKLEDYDEPRHGDKGQYILVDLDIGGTKPIHITGPRGDGEPIFTDTLVAFNAKWDEGEESYAPFQLGQEELIHGNKWSGDGYASWKTPYCPHDLLVTAALTRLVYHFPELCIRSDEGASGMWEGVELCKIAFGFGENPISRGGPDGEK